MSAFTVAICLDEYTDHKRAAQDMLIEMCAEMEADDYEWDEADEFVGIGRKACFQPIHDRNGLLCLQRNHVHSAAYLSEDQKRGLVRRYAPRKALLSYNYVLTYRKWYEPDRLVPFCF
jgi:hypothetical protein